MTSEDVLSFPPGFLWGAATASHQVEGGNDNNQWWLWEQGAGHISDGTQSGRACDWWHRAEQDLEAAAELGHNAHRLSLEWSRLEPEPGDWDTSVVERYRQILGAMVSLGIEPMVTLNHFALPLWLYEKGGWEWTGSILLFARFARRVVEAFGDLCYLWCTINEPMVYLVYGYVTCEWPPGSGGLGSLRRAYRNMVQAHLQAYETIHRHQTEAQVGFAKHIHIFDPADPQRWLDRLATRVTDWLFNGTALAGMCDGQFMFPFGSELRVSGEASWTDFVGLNYYSRSLVTFGLEYRDEFFVHRFSKADAPFSMAGWGEIYAEGLYRSLKRLAGYGKPIYITEFGVPDNDDSVRPRFLVEHLAAVHRAICEGVLVQGAYFWSLVDNFEWGEGWSARFGLIRVDPETQERRVKASAQVYRRIAEANGLERTLVHEIAPDLSETLFGDSPKKA